MRKILIFFVFAVASLNINAQSEEFKADSAKLVEIISENAFKPYIAQFTEMIPDENKEAFKEELTGTFPELYNAMAVIYMDSFTHEEIKGLLAFYATPLGKKLADKSGELSQKGMAAGQAWGLKVQEVIGKHQ